VPVANRRDLFHAAILLIIGAVLAIGMILWLGGKGVLDRILALNPLYLLLAIGLQMCYMLLWSLRWGLIVHAQGQEVPRDIATITLSGAFFNNITPVSKTGGEPVRGYLMGKATHTSFEEGMASVIVDRIFDMVPFVIICLATFALIFIFNLAADTWLLIVILIGLVTSTLFSAVFIYGLLKRDVGFKVVFFFVDRLEPLIARFRPVEEFREKAEEAIDRFYEGVAEIKTNPKLLAVSLLISLLLWLMIVLRLKVVFLSLGSNQPLLIVNIVAIAMVFSGFVPFLPGGLVITEGVMIGLFIGLGVQRDTSASAVLVDRFISFWLMILLGGISSLYLGIRLKIVNWKGKS